MFGNRAGARYARKLCDSAYFDVTQPVTASARISAMPSTPVAAPPRLQPGDEIRCICGKWHALFSQATDGDKPAVMAMLYYRCRTRLYYGGTQGQPAFRPSRRPVGLKVEAWPR